MSDARRITSIPAKKADMQLSASRPAAAARASRNGGWRTGRTCCPPRAAPCGPPIPRRTWPRSSTCRRTRWCSRPAAACATFTPTRWPASACTRETRRRPTDATARKRSLRAAVGQAGGLVKVVAAKVGGVTGSDGAPIKADMQLAGAPSVLFDAVALLVSDADGAALLREAAADGFVRDAYAHCKLIGHTAGTAGLLSQAGVPNGAGIVSLDAGTAGMFVRGAKQGRVWDREAKARAVF